MKYAKFIESTLTNATFSGTPSADFIARRNKIIAENADTETNLEFRFSSEFPEHHQCEIDPQQHITSAYAYDVDHDEYGRLDYKLFSKQGVHLSGYIMEQILSGKIEKLAIWRWVNNPSGIVHEGREVGYEILGLIDGRDALAALDPTYRGRADKRGRIGGRFFIEGLH